MLIGPHGRHHQHEGERGGSTTSKQFTDRYGFTYSITTAQLAGINCQLDQERQREAKYWGEVLAARQLPADEKKLKKLVRKGIPFKARPWVWPQLLRVQELKGAHEPGYYQGLVDKAGTSPSANQIEVDLKRTFPEHPWLQGGEGQKALRRILLAYSIRRPAIGYCQSMNYLVGFLLLVLGHDEPLAFWCFVRVMEDIAYPGTYAHNLVGCHVEIRALEDLVRAKFKHLAAFLAAQQCEMSLLATDWFLCLFCTSLPAETAARVWDALIHEGPKIIFRVGLACLKLLQEALMRAEHVGEIVMFLKRGTREMFDREELMTVAFDKIGSMPMARITDIREVKEREVARMLEERERARPKRQQLQEAINRSVQAREGAS